MLLQQKMTWTNYKKKTGLSCSYNLSRTEIFFYGKLLALDWSSYNWIYVILDKPTTGKRARIVWSFFVYCKSKQLYLVEKRWMNLTETWPNLLALEPNVCLFTRLHWLWASRITIDHKEQNKGIAIINSIVKLLLKYILFQIIYSSLYFLWRYFLSLFTINNTIIKTSNSNIN